MHLGSRLLGEVEVVLDQGVLGVVAATGHAGAAVDAGLAGGAGPTEERVLDLRTGLGAEQHAHVCWVEGVADSVLTGKRLHDVIGWRVTLIGRHAQHLLGLCVVGCELGLPVRDVSPLRVGVEVVERFVQRVGVDQRASSDACTTRDQHVLEECDAHDAEAARPRCPHVTTHSPRGLGELIIAESATGLHHSDAVALLGQPQSSDTPAEPRTHHHDVVVKLAHPGSIRAC